MLTSGKAALKMHIKRRALSSIFKQKVSSFELKFSGAGSDWTQALGYGWNYENPSSFIGLKMFPSLLQRFLALPDCTVRTNSSVCDRGGLVNVGSIELLPLEVSKDRVENKHAHSSNLNKIFPPLMASLLCCGGLYSIYRGIRNMKFMGNWWGQLLFWLGVGLFGGGAFILVSLTREIP
jgi:hypothetical protein